MGQFAPPVAFPGDTPLIVHANVLPDGKVLFWGRDKATAPGGGLSSDDVTDRSTATIWNPVTNSFQAVNNTRTNLFCSSQTLLADGRLFVAGGHKRPGWNTLAGEEDVNFFNPLKNSWSAGTSMSKGRWYPFTVALQDGRVAILAGTYEVQTPNGPGYLKQLQPEIYDPNTNQVSQLTPLQTDIANYPFVFLDPVAGTGPSGPHPNRGVFIAGPTDSYFWNPSGGTDGRGSWSQGTRLPQRHRDGSAVMYDAEEGRVLLIGGRDYASQPALSAVKTITLNQQNPTWQTAAPMNFPRSYHTSTILPDGKVLVTSGIPCNGGLYIDPCPGTTALDSTKHAEMWDPASGQWSLMAKAEITRGYHSTSFLLPDATVVVTGHGNPDGMRPADADTGSVRRHNYGERNIEIYSPPYLFDPATGNRKTRPVINSVTPAVAYGQQFPLYYGNAAGISRVAWVRLPTVTHGFVTDQRINVLNYTATPGQTDGLTVTAPGDPRKCPPGYYMLFVFDQNNTPSVAKIVSINHQVAADGKRQEEHIGRRSVRSNDRIHLFYRHVGDRTLRYKRQTAVDSNTFGAPVTLDPTFVINSNPLAVHNADGRLEVFALNSENKIYSNRQVTAGSDTWGGWRLIGASPSSLPAFAVARNLDGRIQVFYRGADWALWHISQTAPASSTWTQPVSLGGGLLSEPAVGINADGRLEVFVRGMEWALHHISQRSPGSDLWDWQSSLGGGLTSAPFVAHQSDGRLDVFVRGTDFAVYHIPQAAPNGTQNWSTWEGLGGSVRSDHDYVTPVATLNHDGRLQVFVRWSDDTVRTMAQNAPNGSFPVGQWTNLPWSVNATVPPPARGSDGRLFLFVRGPATDLYSKSQLAPNGGTGWGNYEYLGDGAHSF